jgi:glycosyltransferase involved in cell wall biosynthesis
MMVETPLVSIVTIFLNEESFLQDAIESVLAQTYCNWELLLVDDGSDDASTGVAKSYARKWSNKISYLEHDGHCNRGMSASRNLGVRHAKGAYVAFLDADDAWFPDKLNNQVAILNTYTDAAMVFGKALYWRTWMKQAAPTRGDFIRESGLFGRVYRPPILLQKLYPLGRGNSPCPSDLLMRRELLTAVGGFEESFSGMFEDQVFLSKVFLESSVFISEDCSTKYRLHAESCCAIAEKSGVCESARLHYLDWLHCYLAERKIENQQIWKLLRKAGWQYRHPILHQWMPAHLMRKAKVFARRVEATLIP